MSRLNPGGVSHVITEPLSTEILLNPHGYWTAQILDANGHAPDALDTQAWRHDVTTGLKLLHHLHTHGLLIIHPAGYSEDDD